jgi:hypothetical protein
MSSSPDAIKHYIISFILPLARATNRLDIPSNRHPSPSNPELGDEHRDEGTEHLVDGVGRRLLPNGEAETRVQKVGKSLE